MIIILFIEKNYVKAILQYSKVSANDFDADVKELIKQSVDAMEYSKGTNFAKVEFDTEITPEWIKNTLIPSFKDYFSKCIDMKSAVIVSANEET